MVQFEIKNLIFNYLGSPKKEVLKNLNFSIEKGEYVCILGKSGSGKTSLLRQLKPSLTPFGEKSGVIYYDGKNISDLDRRKEATEIGFVMQNPDSQIVTDKVWHELAFGLENIGENQETIRLRTSEMASYFGIEDWFDRDVQTLSGGQKQLLNLASVMVMRPKVLILDEPTSQLDPIAASDFLSVIKKINLELGTTIIITEHRLTDILPVCDKAICLEDGKISAMGSPREIGRELYENGSEMFNAMPDAMKLFYMLSEKGLSPISVRDGRNYLDEKFKDCNSISRELSSGEDGILLDKPSIELRDVYFRYEKDSKDVLRALNLKIAPGKLTAILGGNGAGKSTLLKLASGLIKPYSGRINISGKPISKYGKGELFKNNLAMLPQNPHSLFVKKTVYEELLEMTNDEAKIKEIAKLCDIEKLFDSHPYDISGGEEERVALAKVLLTDPKILLLDEPTKGMDNFFKEKFAEILKKLLGEGKTIIMVSHDIEFAAKYADIVSLIFNGEIISMSEPRKFFAENSFYTTSVSRMTRHIFKNAITLEDIFKLCKINLEN